MKLGSVSQTKIKEITHSIGLAAGGLVVAVGKKS